MAVNRVAANDKAMSFTVGQKEESLTERLIFNNLASEGGDRHFLRGLSTDPEAENTRGSTINGDKSSARKRSAELKETQRQAAFSALENEKKSAINKLAPFEKATAIARLAGLDAGPHNQMALRAIVDAAGTDTGRRRRRQVVR